MLCWHDLNSLQGQFESNKHSTNPWVCPKTFHRSIFLFFVSKLCYKRDPYPTFQRSVKSIANQAKPPALWTNAANFSDSCPYTRKGSSLCRDLICFSNCILYLTTICCVFFRPSMFTSPFFHCHSCSCFATLLSGRVVERKNSFLLGEAQVQ